MMIYTPLTKTALSICFEVHKDQMDRSGAPYVFHPFHVAETVVGGEAEVAAALLHDVVEDSEWTFEDLRARGITEEVLEALRLLTHEDGVSYEDYIDMVATNPIAVAVKLADLAHNMDVSRANNDADINYRKQKKYRAAYEKLSKLAWLQKATD